MFSLFYIRILYLICQKLSPNQQRPSDLNFFNCDMISQIIKRMENVERFLQLLQCTADSFLRDGSF